MYDWMTRELPQTLRADGELLSHVGRLASINIDHMSGMQVACKRGLRAMFQHILRRDHVTVLWKWGPVAAYELDLSGIDSSGDGAADVMEIVARRDASRVTTTFLLDDFMQVTLGLYLGVQTPCPALLWTAPRRPRPVDPPPLSWTLPADPVITLVDSHTCHTQGFLFRLFEQKYNRFGWLIHYPWRLLDACILCLIGYLCTVIKSEEAKAQHHLFLALLPLFALSLAIELWVAALYSTNIKGQITPAERRSRTWKWCQSFDVDLKLIGYGLVAAAAALYILGPQAPGFAYAPRPPIVIDLQGEEEEEEEEAQPAAAAAAATMGPTSAVVSRMARRLQREGEIGARAGIRGTTGHLRDEPYGVIRRCRGTELRLPLCV